jgi:hypothetical protein
MMQRKPLKKKPTVSTDGFKRVLQTGRGFGKHNSVIVNNWKKIGNVFP